MDVHDVDALSIANLVAREKVHVVVDLGGITSGARPEVLAHRLTDLFLDTLPYNAHTTASDALWVGLPVRDLPGPKLCITGRGKSSACNRSTGTGNRQPG